jgi:hypothetical protein
MCFKDVMILETALFVTLLGSIVTVIGLIGMISEQRARN